MKTELHRELRHYFAFLENAAFLTRHKRGRQVTPEVIYGYHVLYFD